MFQLPSTTEGRRAACPSATPRKGCGLMPPAELPHGVLIFALIGYLTVFFGAWWFGATVLMRLIDEYLPGFWDAVDDELVPVPSEVWNENGPPG